MYDYRARWYDPALGRFIQPDAIVPQPGDPQSLNRYSYAANNPLVYNDPSGHWGESFLDIAFIAYDIYDIKANGWNWVNGLSLAADVGGLILPVATGGGLLVRAAFHADDAAKAVKVIEHADEAVDAVRFMEEAVTHADEVVDVVREVEDVAKVAGSKPPIVIGENMTRVSEYADQIGGHAYRPWKNEPFDFDLAMRRNKRWIKDQMRGEREIVDIGPDFARRDATGHRSPFYELERRLIRESDYEHYTKVFERFGEMDGGVPGFDY